MGSSIVETFVLTAAPIGRVDLEGEFVRDGSREFSRTTDLDAFLIGREAVAPTTGLVLSVGTIGFSVAEARNRDAGVVCRAAELPRAAPSAHAACAAEFVAAVATMTMTVAHFVGGDALVGGETLGGGGVSE